MITQMSLFPVNVIIIQSIENVISIPSNGHWMVSSLHVTKMTVPTWHDI